MVATSQLLLQPAAVGAGGISSNVNICIRLPGNRFTLRPVSPLLWRVVSSTGLARRLGACALTATAPSVCGKGLQSSVDNRSCVCKPGYNGANCESNTLGAVNPCSPNPCLSGGTCLGGPDGYTCSCQPGYTGANCETSTACLSNPCQNGGTCTAGNFGSYTCSCTPSYTGTNCQFLACAANTCQNGGTCTNGANGFTCTCPLGYIGTTCQQPQSKSAPGGAPAARAPQLPAVLWSACCAEVPPAAVCVLPAVTNHRH
jgi:hypothetical protein